MWLARSHISVVQVFASAQSPFVRQHPVMAAFVHVPVLVLHVSVVQELPSLQSALVAQQPVCCV